MHNLARPSMPCQVSDLRAGIIEALACYAHRYLKSLSRYAKFFTRHKPTADELASNAIEKLWQHRLDMYTEKDVHVFLRQQIYTEVCGWMREVVLRHDFNIDPTMNNDSKN